MPERTHTSGFWQIARLTVGVVLALVFAPIAAVALVGLAIVGAPIALVGVPTRTVESWGTIVRWSLIAVALTALAPGAIIMLVLAAFFLAPVALICIPFMLPVFFDTAAHEHEHEREHRMLPHTPAHAH